VLAESRHNRLYALRRGVAPFKLLD
jgi:hypothetical protein